MPFNPLPLLGSQQRVWLESLQQGAVSRDNVALAVALEGEPNVAGLQAVLRDYLEEQETARGYCRLVQGVPCLHVAPPPEEPLLLRDVPDSALETHISDLADTVFHLETPPLFRVALLQQGPERHVLAVVWNRLVADERSLALLLSSLEARCADDVAPSHWQGSVRTFAELHVLEERRRTGKARDADRAFWADHFPVADFTLNAENFGDSPYVRTTLPAGCDTYSLPRSVARTLAGFAHEQGQDPDMLLRAGFMALIYRYTLAERIGLLLPVDNRESHAANVFAPLAGRRICHAAFHQELTGHGLLDALARQEAQETRHLNLSLEAMLQARESRGGVMAYAPPDLCFGTFGELPETLLLGKVKGRVRPLRSAAAAGILEISPLPALAGHYRLAYAGGRFSARFLKRFSQHFALLLQAMCRQPDARLRALPIVTTAEKRRIITVWNASDTPLPQGLLLHDQFKAATARDASMPALVSGTGLLSRGETLAQASRMAHVLLQQGLQPGELVAVSIPKGPTQALAVIATSLAGGAYMPLDLNWPDNRLAAVLQQARPRCLLADAASLPRFQALPALQGVACLAVDRTATWAGQPETPPVVQQTPDTPAYVVFTSGSTGTPKGVVMSHRMALNSILDVNRRFQVGKEDTAFALANLTFDLSTYDIFGLLGAGGSVIFPDHDRIRDPRHWLERMRQHTVTIWNTVPGFMVMLVEAAEVMISQGGTLPDDLRLVLLCGDFMPLTLPRRIRRLFPKAQVHNLGGASECSIWSVTYPVTRVAPGWRSIPYGRPLGNQKAYVLDDGLEHCPVLAPGRIFIGGKGVGMGYYGNEALTNAVFINHPVTGERLYDCGDLGRWLPGGFIELLGREDFQLKINGFRIELGEIETALESLPQVERAVAAAMDRDGTKRLAAFVVLAQGGELCDQLKKELRKALFNKLPYYMVPEYYLAIQAVPLSSNGKVNRKALPSPAESDRIQAAVFAPPRTQHERILVEAVGEVLGLKRVSVLDSFTALGGDSLQSLSLAVAVEIRGLFVTPEQILAAPTLSALAREAGVGQAREEVHPAAGVYPMLPVQRYYFGWATHTPHHFNVSELFSCKAPLDRELLQKALRILASHHDSLRFRFRRKGRIAWEMRLLDESDTQPAPVDFVDVSSVAARNLSEVVVKDCLKAEASLNVGEGPVLRLRIFDSGPGRPCHVLVTCHHLVNDGFSFGILMEDLQTIYTALQRGVAPRLPRKTTFYGKFAKQLVRYAKSDRAHSQMSFWCGVTESRCLFPVDVDTQDSLQKDIRVRSIRVLEPGEYALLAKQAGGALHATIKHLLLAALLAAANDRSGQNRLTLHIVGHGREHVVGEVDVSRTIGWFVTHTPLTLHMPPELVQPDICLHALAREVGRQVTALPDNGIGHGALRHYGGREEQKALAPLDRVTTLFNYLGPAIADLHSGQLFAEPAMRISERPDPVNMENPADYSLYIFSYVRENALLVDFCYSIREFNEASMDALAQSFRTRLPKAVATWG